MPHQRLIASALLVTAALGVAHAETFAPSPLPDPGIPGFAFPESEATLTRWITTMTRTTAPDAALAFDQIHRHGWGLWTALTSQIDASENGQPLRVFETWQTLDEISAAPAAAPAPAMVAARSRTPLRPLTQLRMIADEREAVTSALASDAPPAGRVLGFVKFDPSGAEHMRRQQLWQKSTLDTLLDAGAQQVPPFPATTLAVKPIFQLVHTRDLVGGRYYLLPAWSGPPATARIWAPSQWPGAVWIDVLDGGNGHGAVDPLPVFDGSTRTDETTYPLSSLLYRRLSAEDAAFVNAERAGSDASSGDIALLLGMHVSGREIARWTWQTFWWTPNPENPGAPSSARIARLRPGQLRGAARNYAMALGYSMLSPDQPYTGGSNTSPAVYVYNPWLEARLGPADLPDSQPGLGPDGQAAGNNFGVQSNCMSCHAQANYNPNQRATAPRPTGARYVDVGAAEFVGTLQVDFLWSLARHAK